VQHHVHLGGGHPHRGAPPLGKVKLAALLHPKEESRPGCARCGSRTSAGAFGSHGRKVRAGGAVMDSPESKGTLEHNQQYNEVLSNLASATPVSEQECLDHTARISFELSNLCNYSRLHRKCPVSLEKEPVILSAKVVKDTLLDVKRLLRPDKILTVAFHTYNEPLIDPRLFWFIDFAKKTLGKLNIFIATNGFYLEKNLIHELFAIGVTKIHVTGYSQKEIDRLTPFVSENFSIMPANLDARMDLYSSELKTCNTPCHAPLSEIIVKSDGSIDLCCLDWQKRYTFGNLYQESLSEILKRGQMHKVHGMLSKGHRFLDLCKRCGPAWSR
jgi:hypothetical protein